MTSSSPKIGNHRYTDRRNLYVRNDLKSFGLKEIEHLSTPVDFKKIKKRIVVYYEGQFFQRNVHIIPGIKTLPQGMTASVDTVVNANNMRGEETELLGILHRCPDWPAAEHYSASRFPYAGGISFDGTIENISPP